MLSIEVKEKVWEKEKQEYNYLKEKEKPKEQKKDEKEKKEKTYEGKDLPDTSGLLGVMKILVIALGIGLIAYLIYLGFGGKMGSSSRNKKIQALETVIENLDEESFVLTKFERLRDEAYKNGDFRLAMRFSFLDTLQRLQNRKLVKWRKDNTNFDYLFALQGSNYYDGFHSLVTVFDLVWYGERNFNKTSYDLITKEYLNYNNQLG